VHFFLREARRICVLRRLALQKSRASTRNSKAEFYYLFIASSARRRRTLRMIVIFIGVPVLFT
jgi:hypothetical protein